MLLMKIDPQYVLVPFSLHLVLTTPVLIWIQTEFEEAQTIFPLVHAHFHLFLILLEEQ